MQRYIALYSDNFCRNKLHILIHATDSSGSGNYDIPGNAVFHKHTVTALLFNSRKLGLN